MKTTGYTAHTRNKCKILFLFLAKVGQKNTSFWISIKVTYHQDFFYPYCPCCYKMLSNHFHKSVVSIKIITSINLTIQLSKCTNFKIIYHFLTNIEHNLLPSDGEPSLKDLIHLKFPDLLSEKILINCISICS